MAEYINWLKEPAILRGIAAHSDQNHAAFAKSNAATSHRTDRIHRRHRFGRNPF